MRKRGADGVAANALLRKPGKRTYRAEVRKARVPGVTSAHVRRTGLRLVRQRLVRQQLAARIIM